MPIEQKEIEDALKALTSVQTMVTGFDKDLKETKGKLDGLDLEKLNKAAETVTKVLETQQADQARIKAAEDSVKAMEAAINRVAESAITPESKEKELQAKRTKHFNEWAKSESEMKESFGSYLKRAVKDEAELKSLTTISDPNGGYLVMPEFGGIIQTKIYETTPIRQLASVINVGTDQYEYLLDNDEAASGWVGEVSSRSETNTPTLGKIIIPVNELYANPKASQKMLDDGIIDVEGWLAGKVSEKFARDEATAFTSGNGVLKPKGLLSYTSGTDIAAQNVEQVNSGSATTFTYNGLVSLQNALKEGYQNGAVFLIRRASNVDLMTIKDGEGRPIFNMMYDKNVGLTPTLMGQPVYFGADMPAVSGNNLAMIYGNLKTAYQIVDRMGIRVLRDPFTAKPYVHFYTTKRVGGAVVNFEAYKIGKIAA